MRQPTEAVMALTITSPAFEAGAEIPSLHTCDGKDVSPELRLGGVPQGAKSLVLIVHDPDAPDPRGRFEFKRSRWRRRRAIPTVRVTEGRVAFFKVLGSWPVARQVVAGDARGLDGTAASPRTEELRARTARADRVVKSVCPYCAVGCGQTVHVKEG